MYTDCSEKKGANFCSRNAECVQSAGGSMWCTGPKITSCFVYQRFPAMGWATSARSLSIARAYAASVVLPDGRVWVLGGAGSTNVLKTTELIEASEGEITKIRAGPDMPQPLMGHCAAVVDSSKVIVLGGFSSAINDYNPKGFMYDFGSQEWVSKSWMSPGARMDSSCLNVKFGGKRKVIFAGGWNNVAQQDTAYLTDDFHWNFLTGSPDSPDPLPFPLRSSVLIERNSLPYLVGGVKCQPIGRPCSQTTSGEKCHLISYFLFMFMFIPGQNTWSKNLGVE